MAIFNVVMTCHTVFITGTDLGQVSFKSPLNNSKQLNLTNLFFMGLFLASTVIHRRAEVVQDLVCHCHMNSHSFRIYPKHFYKGYAGTDNALICKIFQSQAMSKIARLFLPSKLEYKH